MEPGEYRYIAKPIPEDIYCEGSAKDFIRDNPGIYTKNILGRDGKYILPNGYVK